MEQRGKRPPVGKSSGTVPLESLIPGGRRPSTSRQTRPGQYGLGRCGGRRERPDSAKGSWSWQPSVPLQICFIVPAHHQVFVRLCVPVLGSGLWPPDAWLSSSYPQLLRVCARLELCPRHSQRGTFLHASPRLTHQGRLQVHDALQPPRPSSCLQPALRRIQHLDKEGLFPEREESPFTGVWSVPRAGWSASTKF